MVCIYSPERLQGNYSLPLLLSGMFEPSSWKPTEDSVWPAGGDEGEG